MNTLAAKLGMKAVVFKVTDKGKQQGSGQVRIPHQRGFFSSQPARWSSRHSRGHGVGLYAWREHSSLKGAAMPAE
jgi:hypothetical protein